MQVKTKTKKNFNKFWKFNAICLRLLKMIYYCMVMARFPVECFTFPRLSSPHFRLEKKKRKGQNISETRRTRARVECSRALTCV